MEERRWSRILRQDILIAGRASLLVLEAGKLGAAGLTLSSSPAIHASASTHQLSDSG